MSSNHFDAHLVELLSKETKKGIQQNNDCLKQKKKSH